MAPSRLFIRFQGMFLTGALAVGIAIGLLVPVTQVDAATDYGWRWFSTTAIVENRTASYGTDIGGAAYAYNNSTDLSVSVGGSGNIMFIQGNYGATGWDARAEPFNQYNQPCWLNSNCNKTDRKAHYAYIYFNDHYGAFSMPKYGARHEMGHVFGLGHVGCTWSIMADGGCRSSVPEYLQLDDINAISSWH